MIELHAYLRCERCGKTILQMNDVQDMAEAERRRDDNRVGWCEDESGDEVCEDCWKKWDAEHPAQALERTS